jgi:hypothetical protein
MSNFLRLNFWDVVKSLSRRVSDSVHHGDLCGDQTGEFPTWEQIQSCAHGMAWPRCWAILVKNLFTSPSVTP